MSPKHRGKKLTEITQQTDIIPLHTDTRRDQQAPPDSLGIEPDALQQRHLVLLVCCQLGIVPELVLGLGGT